MSDAATNDVMQSAERSMRGGGIVAYLSSQFPLRSETFVYREVRELRRRGWNVVTASLHHPPDIQLPECADLGKPAIAYSRGMFLKTLAEVARHPLRAIGTFAVVLKDAILPGEPLGIAGRFKLFGQALAALALARSL